MTVRVLSCTDSQAFVRTPGTVFAVTTDRGWTQGTDLGSLVPARSRETNSHAVSNPDSVRPGNPLQTQVSYSDEMREILGPIPSS